MSSRAGQVAVVTGAGSGMGRAIAHALAAEGVRVFACARTHSDLAGTASSAPAGAATIEPRTCDVTEPAEVEAVFDAVATDAGRLDVLVCSHGLYQGGVGAIDLPLEQYDRTMAVNVRGTLHCAQRAAAAMRDGGRGGRVVFVSSMNADASQRGAVDYDTSKAAVHGLTRALALELADERITVNAIAPGWVRTPMSADELVHLEGEGLVMNPLHRVGEPEDIALAAMWLTHPDNAFVTGSVVRVDGGQLAMLARPWPAGQESIV